MNNLMDGHPFPAEPVAFLHLKGDAFAIGIEHARAFKGTLEQGMLGFYHDFWGRAFRTINARVPGKFLRSINEFALHRLLQRRVARLPEDTRDYLKGLSEGSGLPLETVGLICLLPDLLPYLQGQRVRVLPSRYVPPSFGCTSLIHRRYDGSLIYGRNLDFPGVGYWDRFQVMQRSEKKGALKSLHFTSVGIPLGGITGINEAGISVSLHQHYSKQVSWHGDPPFAVAERVLDQARSLDQAIEVLQQCQTASAWAFVVCDFGASDAVVFEVDSRYKGMRRLSTQKGMTHSNYFRTEACRALEFSTSERMNWDNIYRAKRLLDLLEGGSDPDGAQICQYMSDSVDAYRGEEKVTGRTVAQAHNIQSVVIDGGERKVYLAKGNSPIHLNFYHAYNLDELLDSPSSPQPVGQASPYQFQNQNVAAAKRQYILSMAHYTAGRPDLAFKALEVGVRHHLDLESGITWAISLMKRDDLRSAIHVLEGLCQKEEDRGSTREFPPEYYEARLYLCRAYQLAGNSRGAQHSAKIARQARDRRIRSLIDQRNRFTAAKLNQQMVPYSMYLPLE